MNQVGCTPLTLVPLDGVNSQGGVSGLCRPGRRRLLASVSLHQYVAEELELSLGQRLGEHVRHIELCGDKVDGDGAVLNQLADELDPHVQCLTFCGWT